MKRIVVALFWLISLPLLAQMAPVNSKPRVRTVTAFVRLDRANYQKQVADTLVVLRRAEAEFRAQGYEVQSVRITTQPLAELVSGLSEEQALAWLKEYDALSAKERFLANIGPAIVRESDDPKTMHLLERVLSTLPNLNASAIIADESGIHWKSIRRCAELVKYVEENSPKSQGNFNFAVTAMLKPGTPFYPGSYHLGGGRQFAIGFEFANVVRDVFAKDKGKAEAATTDLTAALTVHAKVADTIGDKVAAATGWSYTGVDVTATALGDVSIAGAMEAFTGARFGSSGTMTAARIITTAEKAIQVKQVGYSGLMLPVLEDKLMAQRWGEGAFDIDSLLAYSAVCATGLDTVPLPGDVSVEQIERIFGDIASLAFKWNKPLAGRLLPVKGKKAGEQTEFEDPYLFNTKLRELP
ncbi:MAG TPA: DUF711 family protein [Terriglobales bacterium]|nr:DUF711 family protein [Terriglobales bacterium]